MYAWCTDHIEPDKLEEWEYQMNAPLPGQKTTKVSDMQAEDEGNAFMALMGQVRG